MDMEITGRLGELQAQWLRSHYTADQIRAAIESLRGRRKPYPLNIARVLRQMGGPEMPPASALLDADPVTQAEAERVRREALARLRELRQQLASAGGGPAK